MTKLRERMIVHIVQRKNCKGHYALLPYRSAWRELLSL